jgi:hypothetical protein
MPKLRHSDPGSGAFLILAETLHPLFLSIPEPKTLRGSAGIALKCIAVLQIRSLRFKSLFSRMSLSRNSFPLSGDML